MRRFLFGFFILGSVSLHPHWANAQDIAVTVNGMVCSLCAHGLHKKFSEHESVKEVVVEFDEKKVLLTLEDESEISDSEIEEVVRWGGYEVEKIVQLKRTAGSAP